MKYSNLTHRISGKGSDAWTLYRLAKEREQQGEDIIILSIGDPDFDTPSQITETAISSLRAGDTHYADMVGDPELRSIIADHHREETGQTVTMDQVVVLAGAQCGLFSAAQCVLDPGDEVIVPEPTYVTYEAVIGATGATIVNVPMRAENHFHVDPSDIESAVTEKTRAILLNSPHNPTGAALSHSEMEAIAEICTRHDLWIISDEVYASLTFDREHVSPCMFPGMGERTIVINSLSKSHAMSGWRLGWIVGPEVLAKYVGKLALCMLYGSPKFIQEAAKVALKNDISELKAMKQAYLQRRNFLYERLSNVETLTCHLPEAGIFMMIDVSKTGLSSQTFAEILLDKFQVSVLPTDPFGPSGVGYVRLSLGVPEKDLSKACERLIECERYIKSGRC